MENSQYDTKPLQQDSKITDIVSWIPDMTYHIEHLLELKELQEHILPVKQWC